VALQQLPYVVEYPFFNNAGAAPTVSTLGALTTAGTDYNSFILCAREAMTITHVAFRMATATGSPVALVSIETVDPATGIPNGLWAASTSHITAGLTAAWQLVPLDASASISPGQVFAVKIKWNSAGSAFNVGTIQGQLSFNSGLPYLYNVNNSVGAKVLGGAPSIVLGSSSTTFYSIQGSFAGSSTSSNAWSTSGDAKGARFQVPFKCRCAGLRVYQGTAVGNFSAGLYDDFGTELSSSSTSFTGLISSNLASANLGCYFDNPVILSPATWYRALCVAAGTNINMYTMNLPSNIYLSGYPGGSNFYLATLTGGTPATDDTKVPFINLIIDQLDDGVSTGGGKSRRTAYMTS
jgi:hypothetical protein